MFQRKLVRVVLTIVCAFIVGGLWMFTGTSSAHAAGYTCTTAKCDHTDPTNPYDESRTICAYGASSSQSITPYDGVTVQLRWSSVCGTNWARVYIENGSAAANAGSWTLRVQRRAISGESAAVDDYHSRGGTGGSYTYQLFSPADYSARACFAINTDPPVCTNYS